MVVGGHLAVYEFGAHMLVSSESLGGGQYWRPAHTPCGHRGTMACKTVLPVQDEAGPHLLVHRTVRIGGPSQDGPGQQPPMPFLTARRGGTWQWVSHMSLRSCRPPAPKLVLLPCKPSLGDSQAEGILAQSRVWPFAAPSGPS